MLDGNGYVTGLCMLLLLMLPVLTLTIISVCENFVCVFSITVLALCNSVICNVTVFDLLDDKYLLTQNRSRSSSICFVIHVNKLFCF